MLEPCFGYFPTDDFSKPCQWWLAVKCSAANLQKTQAGLPFFFFKLACLSFFTLIPGRVKHLILGSSVKEMVVPAENSLDPNLNALAQDQCLIFLCVCVRQCLLIKAKRGV